MTIMWSTTSCCSYLLNFMNKYLEGTIYQNNYMECISGMIAVYCGATMYKHLGKKGTFYTAFGFIFVGGSMIYAIESKTILVPESMLSYFSGGPV